MDSADLEVMWPQPDRNLALAQGAVHVWRIAVIQPENIVQLFRTLLSPDELVRADRFHFARDRGRFVMAQGAVRQILSSYLHCPTERVQFVRQKYGKPELVPDSNPIGLTFSLAHSGDLAVVAVGLHMQLGIDVELIRDDFGSEEVAERFFSKLEITKLRSVPADQHKRAFFQCWTRKEAYIKARGEGLSIQLKSFDVAFAPGEAPALLAVRQNPADVSRWSVYDFQPEENYAAALVAEGNRHEVRCWTWKNKYK